MTNTAGDDAEALIARVYCSTLLITCSDFRFKAAERAFALSLGLADDYDLIARPGSIRALVAPRTPASRETMLQEMRALLDLHQFARIVAVNHARCRAYDDIATPDDEREIHAQHLRMARAYLDEALASVQVETWLLDLVDGALQPLQVE